MLFKHAPSPEITTDLILHDDGQPVKCQNNMVKLGFFGTWWHFYSYSDTLSQVEFNKVIEAIKGLLMFLVFTILFPIAPFLNAYFNYRRARRHVNEFLLCKACRELFEFKKSKDYQ